MSEREAGVYEAIFYAINNPALIIDLDFHIDDVNDAAVEFLQYDDRGDLIGRPVAEIMVNEEILADVTENIMSGKQWEGETELITKSGRVHFGIGSATPIEIDDELRAIAGVFTDLTERQRYLHSLRILNRVLRHNIRNDINVIMGAAEQIAAYDVNEKSVEALDRMRDRLENIISKANTATQLEYLINQRSQVVVNTIALDEQVRDVVATIGNRHPDVELRFSDELDDASVIANQTVTQVIEAVIDNAITHNDSASPRVEIALHGEDGAITLSIGDNGPGVDPSVEDQIFGREEFDQLHHGEGLSLFFVDQMMRIYGGEVWVEENDPRGSVFNLRFSRPE